MVVFTWTGSQTGAQVRALDEELAKLPTAIGEIRAYQFGPDAGINPNNCDFAVVADFDDAAGYLVYRDHPAHRKVIENYVNPIVAARHAVQYEY
ncbi:MAG TPA: Dabb family protein [Streptosporangiaceae bacterium]|nr:Dabb family protein [Streptosporangiaceae bacterium]